jgi:hypothetical protein
MPLWRRTIGTALTLSRRRQRHRHPVKTVSGRKYRRRAVQPAVSAMGQIAATPTARHDRLTDRRSPRTAERAAARASAHAASSLALSGIARDDWHNLCFEFVGSGLAKGQAQAATGPDGASRNRRVLRTPKPV